VCKDASLKKLQHNLADPRFMAEMPFVSWSEVPSPHKNVQHVLKQRQHFGELAMRLAERYEEPAILYHSMEQFRHPCGCAPRDASDLPMVSTCSNGSALCGGTSQGCHASMGKGAAQVPSQRNAMGHPVSAAAVPTDPLKAPRGVHAVAVAMSSSAARKAPDEQPSGGTASTPQGLMWGACNTDTHSATLTRSVTAPLPQASVTRSPAESQGVPPRSVLAMIKKFEAAGSGSQSAKALPGLKSQPAALEIVEVAASCKSREGVLCKGNLGNASSSKKVPTQKGSVPEQFSSASDIGKLPTSAPADSWLSSMKQPPQANSSMTKLFPIASGKEGSTIEITEAGKSDYNGEAATTSDDGNMAPNACNSVAPDSNLTAGPTVPQGQMQVAAADKSLIDAKPSNEASDRLAEGRRADVTKPKSLRAAEQSKLNGERKQREKQERDREQRDKAKTKFGPLVQKTQPCTVVTPSAESPPSPNELQQSPSSSRVRVAAEVGTDAAPGPLREVPQNSCNADECSKPANSPRKVRLATPAVPPKQVEPCELLRDIPLTSPRAEDNYEMSEPASDQEDDEVQAQRRARKPVPKWCENYVETLHKQADVDPDSIFGSRVPLVRLEEVFRDDFYRSINRHRPKRGRGSSGDWRRDRLTRQEISAYKQKLGHCKGWMADIENMPPASQKLLARVRSADAVPYTAL